MAFRRLSAAIIGNTFHPRRLIDSRAVGRLSVSSRSPLAITFLRTLALTTVEHHRRSPFAVGILDADHTFHEMIPQYTTLPFKATRRFETAFDYVTVMRLSVAQKGPFHPPVPVKDVTLQGIAGGKQGYCKVQVKLSLASDLTGVLEALDPITKAETEVSYRVLHGVQHNADLLQRAT